MGSGKVIIECVAVHKIGPRLVEEHKKEIKIIQIESLVAQILVFVRAIEKLHLPMFALCTDGEADGGEEEDWFSSVQDSLDTSTVSKIVLAVLTGQPVLVYRIRQNLYFYYLLSLRDRSQIL